MNHTCRGYLLGGDVKSENVLLHVVMRPVAARFVNTQLLEPGNHL